MDEFKLVATYGEYVTTITQVKFTLKALSDLPERKQFQI